MGLANELGKRYPANQADFDARAKLMIMEVNKAAGEINRERKTFNNPSVITLHSAFAYFFRYFKINYVGAVQPSAGKEPTPKQLKELADEIRQNNIKAIFIEPQLNPKPAQVLADELNLRVLTYDDLGTISDAKTIAEFLMWNWNAIKAGL
jgi:zinc transport system substrate-binding protein